MHWRTLEGKKKKKKKSQASLPAMLPGVEGPPPAVCCFQRKLIWKETNLQCRKFSNNFFFIKSVSFTFVTNDKEICATFAIYDYPTQFQTVQKTHHKLKAKKAWAMPSRISYLCSENDRPSTGRRLEWQRRWCTTSLNITCVWSHKNDLTVMDPDVYRQQLKFIKWFTFHQINERCGHEKM